METFLNIVGLFFMLSGIATWVFGFFLVSGMAAWAIAAMVYVFYRMCEHPSKEEENV